MDVLGFPQVAETPIYQADMFSRIAAIDEFLP
jgi:hypothetical protein